MNDFELSTPSHMFVHLDDNQDGTCTMTICTDGFNIHTTLMSISLEEFCDSLVGTNNEFLDHADSVTQALIDDGKVVEIPSHIGDS